MTTQTKALDGAANSISRSEEKAQELFYRLIDECVADARIRFICNGSDRTLGRAVVQRGSAADILVRIVNARFYGRVLAGGSLGLGESYMDRDFEIAEGSLQDFLTILLRNGIERKVHSNKALLSKMLLMRLTQTFRGVRNNVQAAYDFGNDFYQAILDPNMIYSCGYSKSPSDSLEEQQFYKLDRICKKLRLERGMRMADIGCGFAGLLIHAAKHYDVTGIGVTLSRNQHQLGTANIARAGLEDKIKIELKDFRELTGQFDRVASVGMFEHVMRPHYKLFFNTIARILTDKGMGLLHAIGCGIAANRHDPFIQKYIFPLSAQPRLSEIAAHLEKNRLALIDVENIVRHYQYTLAGWLDNLCTNRKSLNPQKYNDQFIRMFEFYLCGGIAASRASESSVYQVLFAKDYTADIPLQRV